VPSVTIIRTYKNADHDALDFADQVVVIVDGVQRLRAHRQHVRGENLDSWAAGVDAAFHALGIEVAHRKHIEAS
jgi:hypothetical protein